MAGRQRDEPRLGGFPAYPIPGLLRRARRIAGLSQRDMARATGLSPSTVQRAETGSLTPSLRVFQRVMAAAGLHLAVVDEDGHVVEPMEDWTPVEEEGVRDGAGRRYPVHLDTVLDPVQGEWWADVYGFARPPQTFYRDPPDLREYRRRLSEWQVRRGRFQGRPPPVPPGWWIEEQRERRQRRMRRGPGGLSGRASSGGASR